MIALIEISFALLNIAAAYYQARLFAAGKSISHFVWGAGFALIACSTWFWFHSWQLIVVLLLQRLVVFNSFLNYFRTPRMPLFYLGKASVLDRMLSKIYIPVFIASIIAVVVLNFYI
jgi:hypothetical protein